MDNWRRPAQNSSTFSGSASSDPWPAWVYGSGEDPDYRFSFANERTFLAWIRTALAFVAVGVAVDLLDLSLHRAAQDALAFLMVALGLACAVMSWWRWEGRARHAPR